MVAGAGVGRLTLRLNFFMNSAWPDVSFHEQPGQADGSPPTANCRRCGSNFEYAREP
jgi:hypothetical protein